MSDLVLVIANNSKFVGKLHEEDIHIVLNDAVSVIEVMTERGMAIVSTIVGKTVISKDNIVICTLDAKSPYYQNYFQTTSNIQVTPNGSLPFKRN